MLDGIHRDGLIEHFRKCREPYLDGNDPDYAVLFGRPECFTVGQDESPAVFIPLYMAVAQTKQIPKEFDTNWTFSS